MRSFGFIQKDSLYAMVRGLRHLLWPAACAGCGRYADPERLPLCEGCWDAFHHALGRSYCQRCGRSVSPYGILAEGCGHCLDKPPRYDGLVRAGVYESVFRNLILAMKFRDGMELLGMLCDLLGDVFAGTRFEEEPDLIVPVPLHWRRRLERGFNQSQKLAQVLVSKNLPICTDLVRVRYTHRQWNLTAAQRRKNVKNAFRVRKGHPFEGKCICLVDDITTSGATLNECARTLKQAGAKKVFALVLAVAESYS